MKVLIDTNIILDVLLKREAFYDEAVEVLNLAKKDTVQYSVALLQNMDGIITRNPNDYKKSQIPVWIPKQALKEVK